MKSEMRQCYIAIRPYIDSCDRKAFLEVADISDFIGKFNGITAKGWRVKYGRLSPVELASTLLDWGYYYSVSGQALSIVEQYAMGGKKLPANWEMSPREYKMGRL